MKEIEENNKWKRLEISSRKLELRREHFMPRWTIKNRKCMDLTEAEDLKKGWQEYTEELYKIRVNDLGNHIGVITQWYSQTSWSVKSNGP